MAAELRELFREALELTDNDQATLAGLLIESLEAPPDSGVESAWAEQLSVAGRKFNPVRSEQIPWEKVEARLLLEEIS